MCVLACVLLLLLLLLLLFVARGGGALTFSALFRLAQSHLDRKSKSAANGLSERAATCSGVAPRILMASGSACPSTRCFSSLNLPRRLDSQSVWLVDHGVMAPYVWVVSPTFSRLDCRDAPVAEPRCLLPAAVGAREDPYDRVEAFVSGRVRRVVVVFFSDHTRDMVLQCL